MRLKSSFVLALLAAAGGVAPAGVFAWTADDGSWNNHTNWSGPAGQVPHLTADTASVGVDFAEVIIESAVALGSLHVHNGASVYTHTGALFVAGDVLVEDGGSALVVSDGPALRDLDADNLTVRETYLVLADGTAQIDETLVLDHAAVMGTGVLEMDSTSGDFNLGSGSLWAWGSGASDTRTLTVRRTGSSTAELDWSDPDGSLFAWEQSTLDIQIPVSGVFGGEMTISDSSRVRIADPVIAGAGSEIKLWGGPYSEPDAEAVLEAPIVDSYGALVIRNGESIIDAPFVALRGTADFGTDTYFVLSSNAVILDSFDASVNAGEGGNLRFDGTQTLSVTGGTTTFSTGQFGLFDLDGPGNMTVNIADGSALVLDVHHIELFQVDDFDGTMNLNGAFHLESYENGEQWINEGEIFMDQGQLTGRTLVNEGLIRGSGTIDAEVVNNAEVVAEGGTLFLNDLDINGTSDPATGVLRAETGDMVLAVPGDNIGYYSEGDIFVGNGEGVREVMETNGVFWVADEGSVQLNSGFFRAKQIRLDGEFSTQGVSMLRATETDPQEEGVIFDWGGASTVSGTLEVDGHASTRRTHQFNGEGAIRAVSPVRSFDFMDDTDLSDVSFASAGLVTFDDRYDGLGQATVAGFELEPTATLKIDFGSDTEGFYDSVTALDSAVIDGTLLLHPWNGYTPEAGETITILTAPSVSGEFDEVTAPALDATRRAVVSVEPDRVEVTFYCSADLNTDGVLDLSDVNAFVTAFTSGDMAADIAQPYGLLDLSDVNAFANIMNSGCN